MDESRMAWRKTFLVGMGFFGISLIWPIYDSFVPIFLDSFGLTSSMIGILMTLDNYANLFILPWVGQRSDRTRTRWGRRYPYILVGAPLAAIGAMLIPFAAQISLPMLVGAMLLMTLSMATFRSPAVALLGDFFSPVVRSRANGVINFMGLLAGILSFLIGGQLYKQGQFLPFVVAALTMLGVLALLVTLVREPPQPTTLPTRVVAPGVGASVALLRQLSNSNALMILSALAAWSVGITALQAFFTLFGRNELGLDAGTATQLLSFYPIGGLLFAIPGGYLGTYLGRRTTILLCLAATGAFLALFLTIPAAALSDASGFALMNPATWFANPTIRLIVLLLLGVGAALTIITVNILPLLLDSAPTDQVGSYTGLYYLFGSVASILGPPLGGLLIDLTDSYRTLFFFAPFWVLLGLVLMWLVREERPVAAPLPSQAEA